MPKKKYAGPTRPLKTSDFVGKTVKTIRKAGDNQWRFIFTDGSQVAINAESYSIGSAGSLPMLEIIDA